MNMDKKQEKKHSDQTRDRLLLSGLNLLVKKGYRGAVTREIAMNAGVTEMTLYRHFRSKDELFADVFIEQSNLMLSLFPQPSCDIEADLLKLSTNMITHVSSNIVNLIRVVPELEEQSELRKIINGIKDRVEEKFDMIVKRHLSTLDTAINYSDQMILYMFMGPIFFFILHEVDEEFKFDCKQHVSFFLTGCGLKKAKSILK